MSPQPRERLKAIVKAAGGVMPVAQQLGCSTTWVYMLTSPKSTRLPSIQLAAKMEAIYGIPASSWASVSPVAA